MNNSAVPREIFLKDIYYMQIFVEDRQGNGKPGLIIPYYIYQAKGGYLRKQGIMIEDFTAPGIYVQSYLFNRLGQFRIVYRLPSPYSDMLEIVNVIDGEISIKTFHRHFHRYFVVRKIETKIPKK
ncbi:MAG: hypothetical protein ACFFDY_00555 [Candidatus Thorarchaeota archaeon]